ncbi:MAG TPA: hypothetical protein VG125_21390 [Pirellulales bacterium]|jgi:hypothetical protein|nr:hypothetical protein [Pirellulales bacterium]
MQILEAEIALREETRVAEQSRPALAAEKYAEDAEKLAATQLKLQERVDAAVTRIGELPDGAANFGGELALLGEVSRVMSEAAGILKRPETGAPAIAAETEVIELLLRAKRCDPKSGGGGGGSTPGGGGAEDPAEQPALALLGSGANEKARPDERDVPQSSGAADRTLPEEFRAGLDEYFNRLERERQ